MGIPNVFGFDLPRQALYNFGKGANDVLSGNGSMESVGRMAPGAIGALLTALMGPGAGVIGGGMAQGLGSLIGGEDFAAPEAADLVEAMGGDATDPFQVTGVNMATDPLNWLAGGLAMRGGRQAMDAFKKGARGFPMRGGLSPDMAGSALNNTGAIDLASAGGLLANAGDDLVNAGLMGAGQAVAPKTPAKQAFERAMRQRAAMAGGMGGVIGAGVQPGPAMGGM